MRPLLALLVLLACGTGVARAAWRERPGVTRDVIDGMNHVLRAAPAERVTNLGTYTAPELPLMPGLVEMVCGFLRRGPQTGPLDH